MLASLTSSTSGLRWGRGWGWEWGGGGGREGRRELGLGLGWICEVFCGRGGVRVGLWVCAGGGARGLH
jgi:hypothetical protein